MFIMRRLPPRVLAIAAILAIGASATAQAGVTKPQYVQRADAICVKAIAQTHAIGVVPSVAAWGGPAGQRLLTIDRATLTRLSSLPTPPADTSTLHRLLAGARAAVDETARAIARAKAGDSAGFRADAGVVAQLTNRYQAGARAYGFHRCQRWGS
jgi:hypothetical protein